MTRFLPLPVPSYFVTCMRARVFVIYCAENSRWLSEDLHGVSLIGGKRIALKILARSTEPFSLLIVFYVLFEWLCGFFLGIGLFVI